MRYLGVPIEKGIDVFNAAINSKQDPIKSRLISSANEVFIAYEKYLENTIDLGLLQPISLSTDQRTALIHAYEGRTKPILELKERLIQCCSTCPLCWLSESSTLDHYLPKSIFPEFAIFPPNLVPSCPFCNNTKLDFFIDEMTGIRLFLHPYYDKLPDDPFLNLITRIENDGVILTFKIIQIEGMSNEVFNHISSHFKRLKLGNRYRVIALDTLRETRHGLERQYARGAGAVSEYLKNEADSLAMACGRNYWRTVLFASLANSQEFCDGGFKVIPR